jgi:hypothetical protein
VKNLSRLSVLFVDYLSSLGGGKEREHPFIGFPLLASSQRRALGTPSLAAAGGEARTIGAQDTDQIDDYGSIITVDPEQPF